MIIRDQVQPNRAQILKAIVDVNAVLWTSQVPIDEEIVEAAGKFYQKESPFCYSQLGQNLKVISTMTAGLDYVDMNVLRSKGIKLGYAPKIADGAVADIAVMLILAAMRRLQEGREHILR